MDTENIKARFKTVLSSPLALSAGEHVVKPFLATVFLAAFFFVIVYYRNEDTGFTDRFFALYVFLLPLAANVAISFARINKQKKGALFGLSVVAVPLVAISASRMAGNYSAVPNFYAVFQESGSFFVIYLVYSVFFIVGGAFWGLIDEFLLFEDVGASVKYPDGVQMSKSKRRKMKKKKRGQQKSAGVNDSLINEVIGPREGDASDTEGDAYGSEGDADGSEGDADGEEAAGDDESASAADSEDEGEEDAGEGGDEKRGK